MKLVFSEHVSDYRNYVFPYAVWAFPEGCEKPRELFDAGFLPASRTLDRFYLCRQVRVDLKQFTLSSENRRILRKGEGIQVQLVPRREFDYTAARRDFCRQYADAKFGANIMSADRLDALFDSPLITHVLVYTNAHSGTEVGLSILYCDANALAFYYYAFYDLEYVQRNLGMFMMTSAVNLFAEQDTQHVYLGTCYSRKALYKTQFTGAEFFNGFRWSRNLAELKHLIERDAPGAEQHALESEAFQQQFYEGDLQQISGASRFNVTLPQR
jgi:arginyl-tRNA--protein-N-Asp/Glu arginylyltransferase